MNRTASIAALATTVLIATAGLTGASAADRGGYAGFDRHASSMRVAMIDRRIANQHRRIRFGRRAGKLTWVEARKLRFELSHVRGFRSRYLRDGWMSRPEARHLQRLLWQNSRRIRRLASNGLGSDWRRSRWDSRQIRRDRFDRVGRYHRRRGENRLSRLNGFR